MLDRGEPYARAPSSAWLDAHERQEAKKAVTSKELRTNENKNPPQTLQGDKQQRSFYQQQRYGRVGKQVKQCLQLLIRALLSETNVLGGRREQASLFSAAKQSLDTKLSKAIVKTTMDLD